MKSPRVEGLRSGERRKTLFRNCQSGPVGCGERPIGWRQHVEVACADGHEAPPSTCSDRTRYSVESALQIERFRLLEYSARR